MSGTRPMSDDRFMEPTDSRNRPVVLEAGTPADAVVRRRPQPRTVLALSAVAVVAAGGVLAGSWSVWSAVNPVTPEGTPAPLWFSPPAPVITTTESTAPPSSTEDSPDRDTDDHTGTSTPDTSVSTSPSTERGRGGDDSSGDGHGGGGSASGGNSGPG
jgi:uncharacterized membrane protein YgcG